MKKIYFATGNKGKIKEVQSILDHKVEILEGDLEEIQELDLKKIIKHKVEQAYKRVKAPVFVDDVSVEIDAWQGFPGPFVKFIREIGENKLLLHMLRHEKNRKLKIIAMLGFNDGRKIHYFSGVAECVVAKEERGKFGWGLDTILIPKGHTLTWAEMSEREKNSTSHRRKALNKLKIFLDSQKY